MTSRLFILAGEASGDVLAAQLMHAVVKVRGPVAWSGIGGPHMKEAGLSSSEGMGQLSIIGISVMHWQLFRDCTDLLTG